MLKTQELVQIFMQSLSNKLATGMAVESRWYWPQFAEKSANVAKKNANFGGRFKILPPESFVMSAEPGDRETAEEMEAEDRKYSGITSLNYTEFLLSAKDHLREKSMLYSASVDHVRKSTSANIGKREGRG
ncbi:hypothetical protein M3Y96_00268300 [Aphelenchoides besseyi]|nr:hypothetical protein M3Y96_00268300 [Aphelenchoides besseyi]